MTSDNAVQKDSSSVRAQLWYALLDAERTSRFFAKVADRNRNWHLYLSLCTIVLTLVAGVTLLQPIADVVTAFSTIALFLSIGSLTAVLLVYDFSGRAQAARIVLTKCARFA